MRFLHPDGTTVHLSYCSNVHPGEDVSSIITQLKELAGSVRRNIGTSKLGIGLWIPNGAARRLLQDQSSLAELQDTLVEESLEVVTLNGFPYGGFHDPVVKYKVYRPDWAEQNRVDFTIDLARILATLLPEDVLEGTISTLPFMWPDRSAHLDEATANLQTLASELRAVERETGKRIRIGIEPEPGCIVQDCTEAATLLRDLAPDVIGLCLDACHMAVQFEDPTEVMATIFENKLDVVKMQVSAALRIAAETAKDRHLEQYKEQRFLHQTRCKTGAGVVGVDDLPMALDGRLPDDNEWRVHFHVPIDRDDEQTTQPELREILRILVGGERALTHHLDVETYTWTVLPAGERPVDSADLAAGIAREMSWARSELISLGLEEIE